MSELKQISDEQLMQEIRAGNMLAFDNLYRKYSARIYRFAFSLLKLPEEAENIVQDVFLKLWVNREKIDKGSSIRYYVFSIAYHSSITVIRKKLKETDYVAELIRQQGLEQDSGSLQMEYQELEQKLNAVIDALPARQKEVYLLHRVEGLKYAEIAEQLGLSVNTIENHMARALSAIRTNMGGYSLLGMLFWSLFA
jgi:RNA polymerase sigma-70 factor (family 1)